MEITKEYPRIVVPGKAQSLKYQFDMPDYQNIPDEYSIVIPQQIDASAVNLLIDILQKITHQKQARFELVVNIEPTDRRIFQSMLDAQINGIRLHDVSGQTPIHLMELIDRANSDYILLCENHKNITMSIIETFLAHFQQTDFVYTDARKMALFHRGLITAVLPETSVNTSIQILVALAHAKKISTTVIGSKPNEHEYPTTLQSYMQQYRQRISLLLPLFTYVMFQIQQKLISIGLLPRHNKTEMVKTDRFYTSEYTLSKIKISRLAPRNLTTDEEIQAYQEEAMKEVEWNGQLIRTFAPFNEKTSAIRTVTPGQIVFLVVASCVWLISLNAFGIAVLVGTIGALIVFYLLDLLLNLFVVLRAMKSSPEIKIDDRLITTARDYNWPVYTILCPLYKEAEVAKQFVRAMSRIDYPVDKLQIMFLTEDDDEETRKAILKMRLPSYFEVITVPDGQPRTKPRACNYGLILARGEFVVIYDAEDMPDPLQLKKAVLAFDMHDEDLACVQAKLNFYNPTQNLLTRWFTAEYSVWFDLLLPGLQWLGVALPLGGTSNHFRTHILRKVGAWDPYNVTEDCDLGLRLANFRLHTTILDSTTYEEANSRFKNWIRQRSRWIKGYMLTYLIGMRRPWEYFTDNRLGDFLALQAIIGGRTYTLLVNWIMWLLVVVYIAFQAVITPLFHVLFPTPLLYMGMICLLFGNFFYVIIALLGAIRRQEYSLVKFVLFIPLYWGMMSIAAMMAFWQLLIKPHYWEKTQHGFHLQQTEQSPSSSFALHPVAIAYASDTGIHSAVRE